MSKVSTAVVLVDVQAFALKAGSLVIGDAATIKALVDDGSVDPHKDAIAYARANGAPEKAITSAAPAEADTAS